MQFEFEQLHVRIETLSCAVVDEEPPRVGPVVVRPRAPVVVRCVADEVGVRFYANRCTHASRKQRLFVQCCQDGHGDCRKYVYEKDLSSAKAAYAWLYCWHVAVSRRMQSTLPSAHQR